MFRIILAVIIIVFMFFIFQLFNVIELADSHPNDPSGTERANKYDNLKLIMRSKFSSITLRKPNLLIAQSVIDDLNTSWSNNEAAIKAGNAVTITGALKTLFSTIGAIATGGTSTAVTVSVTGSTFLDAATTYKAASKTDSAILMRSVFVNAYSKALEGYDATIALQKSDHDEYTDKYFEYLGMEVDHDGGLYTDVNGSTLSVEQLYESINGISVTLNSDGSRVFGEWRDGLQKKQTGYHHLITDRYGNSLGSTDHGMETHYHWDAVTIPELPSDKACYGSDTCTQTFRSYYDALYSHFVKCGTAERVEDAAWRIARKIKYQIENYDSNHPNYDSSLESAYPTAYKYLKKGAELRRVVNNIRDEILKVRTQAEGCGRSYYNCISSFKELHTNRRCLANSLQDDGADAGDDNDDSDNTPSTPSYHVCGSHETSQSGDHSAASCGQSGHYNCDSLTHVEEQCTQTNANGDRCTYTFWRCLHPNVPSYGPSHIHKYPVVPPPAVFTPVLTLRYNSKIGAVSMTATANKPIFGADLYVLSPGDGSRYGTKIRWTSGNSNKTTYSLPVRYTFPSTVASGTYKFTLRVYPFNNSGSGNPWGTPYDVSKNVTVQ